MHELRAKGAEYDSQGQARSEAKRVAPGSVRKASRALKGRNTDTVWVTKLTDLSSILGFRDSGFEMVYPVS
jgi:hypothetical protein